MPFDYSSDAPLPEYEVARKKAQQQLAQQKQGASEALERRYAALGQTGSGSQIKQGQLLEEAAMKQSADVNEQIGAAEASDKRGKAFQQETIKQQQGFASGEAEKQRGFQKQLYDSDQAFKTKVFDFQSAQQLKQLDLAEREFQRDNETLAYNKWLSEVEMGNDPGLVGGILGKKGIFGGDMFGGGGGIGGFIDSIF